MTDRITGTKRLVTGAAAVALAASLPYWLPRTVVAARVRIFARVNGEEGVSAPGRDVPAEEFKQVYGHPAANGRSRGAALSDLFWYWLSPGPEVHQEHLEPGPRYDDVARTTRQILAGLSREQWTELVSRCTRRVLDELAGRDGEVTERRVRLRDLMMPVWAEVYYEVVFREPCPRHVRDLIVGNADDVVSALKCTSLRHMERRARLTGYLRDRLANDPPPVPLPSLLSEKEKAYYLQGTFFNTAVVQMSEAMAHLLLALATHRPVQDRLLAGQQDPGCRDYLDHVINETLQHFPLFGIAHRISTGDIPRDGQPPLPTGSVLLFNYPEYQQSGRATNERFDPDRWLSQDTKPDTYIPFGVTANRPCPARGFAVLTMRVAAEEVLHRFRLASSAEHTRSLPSRGPCLLIPRTADGAASGPARRTARLAAMRLGDRWAGIPRSLVQLGLGSYMVWDARRQGLCRNYFAEPPESPVPSPSSSPPSSSSSSAVGRR